MNQNFDWKQFHNTSEVYCTTFCFSQCFKSKAEANNLPTEKISEKKLNLKHV